MLPLLVRIDAGSYDDGGISHREIEHKLNNMQIMFSNEIAAETRTHFVESMVGLVARWQTVIENIHAYKI